MAKRLKILWLSPGFPRPTNRGGQIRTLEILRCLHLRHEIHFLALHDDSTEAIRRSSEYCSQAWPVPYALAPKGSIRFWMQSVRGLVAREPVEVARKHSPAMQQLAEELLQNENYDRVVCDFLTSTVNLPFGEPFILFEHNVETQIWRRYGERGKDALRRWYGGTSYVRQIVCIRSSARRVRIHGLHRTWKKALTTA